MAADISGNECERLANTPAPRSLGKLGAAIDWTYLYSLDSVAVQ